jgi:hypothetical protein
VPTTLFTSQTAAEMAKRSHLPTSARHAIKEPARKPEPLTSQPAEDEFKGDTLARVRRHIKLTQERIDDAFDARDIDAGELRSLAMALKELEGVEARLSNRPAPGNLRPVAQTKSRRHQSYAEPQPMAEPMPVQITPAEQPGQAIMGDWQSLLF